MQEAAIGIVAGLTVPLRTADLLMQALIGWNVTGYLYLAATWFMMLRADDSDVCGFAQIQDEKAYVILVVLSLAALMSLVAIVIKLAGAGMDTSERQFHLAMTAITVLGSWLLIPTIFGLPTPTSTGRARRIDTDFFRRRPQARLLGFSVFLIHHRRGLRDLGYCHWHARDAQARACPSGQGVLL